MNGQCGPGLCHCDEADTCPKCAERQVEPSCDGLCEPCYSEADMSNEIPRRSRLDQNTPAELAIRAALDAVETLPADVRLTDAVVLLQEAREAVADYVDGVEPRKAVARDNG